mmetsp:Transcript_23104/g.30760  ORF Transcript_23104/g.30760 Transcript_23104/m.30760 type:complete len:92 (-) Transcript_23104:461-736(-)
MIICFAMMLTITLSSSGQGEDAADGEVSNKGANYSSSQLMLGYALVFICAWTYAINCVLVRALNFMHSSVLMFWHGILGLLLAVIAVAITE